MRSTAGYLLIAVLCALIVAVAACGQGENEVTITEKVEEVPEVPEDDNDVTLTVVFDNYPFLEGLKTSWGFSCLVEGKEKTVLFDTGGDGDILLYNMEQLGIDPGKIDAVVISHTHGDHTGGLTRLLQANAKIEVYLPASSGTDLKNLARSGGGLVEVSDALPVCAGIWSTGELGSGIQEQALVVETGAGLLVITGCAHPGIVEMVRAAKATATGEVLLAMGGFHLRGSSGGEIERIISELKGLGVSHVGPCHCTGDGAIAAFAAAYGDGMVVVGVGRRIEEKELY